MTGNFKKIVAQRRWLRIVWTFKARTAATQWVLAKDWVLQINENRLVRGQSLNIPFYTEVRFKSLRRPLLGGLMGGGCLGRAGKDF